MNTLRSIRDPRLPRRLLSSLALFSLTILSSCGDDEPPGFVPPPSVARPDAGDLPEPLPPDPAWKEVTCKDFNIIDVGRPEVGQTLPDGVSLIARPGGSNGFLLAIAEKFCPEPCDGGYESSYDSKRTMLYTVGEGVNSIPDAPIMIAEGVGTTRRAHSEEPRLAVVGADHLAVAWLDNVMVPDSHKTEVWGRVLSLSSLAHIGASFRLSEVTWMARKLHLVGGPTHATAIFEDFDPYADPPKPHLWTQDFSANGALGTAHFAGQLEGGHDLHAALRAENDSVLFAYTAPPDLLVGSPDEDGTIVQQDPATNARGEIALARGGVAFGAIRNHRSIVVFRALDENGQPQGNETVVAGDHRTGTNSATHPRMIEFRGGYLLFYRNVTADTESFRGAFLSRSGKVLDDFDLAAPIAGQFSLPAAALSTDGRTAALAWKERSGNTNTTRLLRMRCD